jgi:N-acyl-D-amino-acid deacylase
MAASAVIFGCSVRNNFDIIIKNGTVIDGSGSPPVKFDIAIIDDRISAIARDLGNSADLVIDAEGLVVTPGFFDIHTHTDTELIVDPKAESKIFQGVTTEIGGNCGYSPFPFNEPDFLEFKRELDERYHEEADWMNIAGFYERLSKKGMSLNYASFTGHGNLRSFVVGKNDLKPDNSQMKEMKSKLAESMEMGSLGLSSGLEYAPGSYADTNELIELAYTVAEKGGIYSSHIRNEDDRVEEAVAEAIEISKKTGAPLQISHLKAANPSNWHKAENLLKMIENAVNSGISVHADRYPYIAYGTGLSTFLPLWARQGNTDEMIARLADKSLIKDIEKYAMGRADRIGGWEKVVISNCFTDENKIYEGLTIKEAAAESSVKEFEFVRNILIEEKNRVGIIGFAMNEENLKRILSHDLVMIGSDGNAVSPTGILSLGKPHPRYYGTFPRVLGKYVREENLFDLSTAVKKMTSMPAEKLGIKFRGSIVKGYFADIVIFNPDKISDKATFVNPHQLSVGIEHVIVNGKPTIKSGKHIGTLNGRIIRHISS